MKWSSQAIIAGSLLALGAAAFVVAGWGAEAQVVQVEDLVGPEPPAGQRLLVGVPQPATLPMQAPEGGIRLVANPAYSNTTVRTVAWTDGGAARHSVVTLHAVQAGSAARFTLTNETRVPGQTGILSSTSGTFMVDGLAVPVRAFDDADGDSPVVWTVVPPSDIKEPLRDVPSQFTGRVLGVDASGQPLPPDAVIFAASSYKAGCSSKFVPEPEQRRLDESQAQ